MEPSRPSNGSLDDVSRSDRTSAPKGDAAERALSQDAENDLWEVGTNVASSNELRTDPAAAETAAPRSGARFGRYQVERFLGEGAMGAVYLALDPSLQRRVALKVPKFRSADTDAVARFLREARLAASLHHRNICPIFEVAEIDGQHFLAMAYIEGEPLSERIVRERPFAERDAAELVRALALGMADAHAAGIVHRDLKPSNIMIDRKGEPIVMDFGLARRWVGDSEVLTQEGAILGTPAYMSPEQVRGDSIQVGPLSDIYSLGVVLYELLTGRRPYQGSVAEILAAIVTGAPPAPTEFRPDLSAEIVEICRVATARDPRERFASMEAFAVALRRFLAVRRDAVSSAPEAGSWKSPSPHRDTAAADAKTSSASRQRQATWIIAVLSTAVVCVAAYFLFVAPRRAAAPPSPPQNGQGEPDVAGDRRIPENSIAWPESTDSKAALSNAPVDRVVPDDDSWRFAEFAKASYKILKSRCYICHGVQENIPGLNVLDRSSLIANRGDGKTPFVAPGKPAESKVWQQIEKDLMPQDAPLSDDEKATIRNWIEKGAQFPVVVDRAFVSFPEQVRSIHGLLHGVRPEDRRFKRFISLAASNNRRSFSGMDLRIALAAIAKGCNSLSWKLLQVPETVGESRALIAIDLRDFGWEKPAIWKALAEADPYALSFRRDQDRSLAEKWNQIVEWTETNDPVVRADWFLDAATRPPLYWSFLQLPTNLVALEKTLGVDPIDDFMRDRLARGIVSISGVSRHNVVIDRHPSRFGSYWRSFDFDQNDGRSNAARFPLGPDFPGNAFQAQVFSHAGMKVAFTLPNGMQGYFLTDQRGDRIDMAPINVLMDPAQTSGTAEVVCGLSCIGCHKRGFRDVSPDNSEGFAVDGDARAKVDRLFATGERWNRIQAEDREPFNKSLERLWQPYIEKDESADGMPEPIRVVVRHYTRQLNLESATFELGLDSSERLKSLIRDNPRLRALGMGPLLVGGTIPRSVWAGRDGGYSMFQRVALELRLATPPEPPSVAPAPEQ